MRMLGTIISEYGNIVRMDTNNATTFKSWDWKKNTYSQGESSTDA